jgi:PAS domain S-box-containing protein
MQGKLLERAGQNYGQFLVLESGGFLFHALLEKADQSDGFARLENGSRVAVTGICLIEPGDWQAGENWRAKSFHILLRSPSDVAILQSPPWWTLKKVLGIACVSGFFALAAFAWVVVLRRRVQKQTEIISERLGTEAALKTRFEDLVENANDVVFTHDLSGRMTSINKAGELLLQCSRQSVLSQNIIDLMAEDHREAARMWLSQVIKGAETPTAEWDFMSAGGQRLKLEISSRLIQQNGQTKEVEGIARDITERRYLEREILEISNREQRRIGHDLHDGVCQQLAAVNYLADILGDRLRDRAVPESAEAQRIATLINEANAQARSVARGLFPVRLEEIGLALTLEELASTASKRYRITCRFVCKLPQTRMDSETELHLYYIAQEALLNAINHGKATTIVITLAAEGDRLKLSLQDNGQGFSLSDKLRAGMGIGIMRYRAKVIGATLDIQSEAGRGTQIDCFFRHASPKVHDVTS